ncbi:MAG: alpha-amylase/4-alpha-glucanotransferase domain-containing protein [Gemmatimonadota bacterium]
MTSSPLLFAFGVHIHQPVGNFDHVIDEHVREAYAPFLERLSAAGLLPISLHVSGPLLEWLEEHGSPFLDLIGGLAAEGKLELLLSGFYEPILAALPRVDRLEQIAWMREHLRDRFGVEARGLWLTERVWEPELVADLADAGVRYTLLDDRHFATSGFPRERLHAPFWTEGNGRRLALLAIDERLRYLIPFRPPAEIVRYLDDVRRGGHRLAVLADDGEKFGGWPGTREWVYDDGWLDGFIEALAARIQAGDLRLVTMSEAVAQIDSGGLAYLATGSYREMEKWALPPDAAIRLTALEDELGEERLAGPDGALLRGGHWRNFLVRYPEANRMHKKMLALSALSRERGDPQGARRAIGRAQCNDVYWHGVFGGLYLPHLRRAVWENLATAERILRDGESIAWEVLDLDVDGHPEIWVHSAEFSAIVSPARGGAIEEYTLFERGLNLADVLTRRREAYHGAAPGSGADTPKGGAPSLHELERFAVWAGAPELDREPRALFVDRVLPEDIDLATYRSGAAEALASWAGARMTSRIQRVGDAVEITLSGPAFVHDRPRDHAPVLEKRIRFDASGALKVAYRWEAGAFPEGAVFATEISTAEPVELRPEPEAEMWSFPIITIVRSEREIAEETQGVSLTPRWSVGAGEALVALRLLR